MANDGFRNIVIAFLLVGLFFVAMTNFAAMLSLENNSNTSLLDNEVINSTFVGIEEELGDSQDDAQSQRENVESEVPSVATGAFLLVSIIKAGTVFISSSTAMFNLLTGAVSETFGVASVVIGTISAILLLSLVFLAWRLYKAGE